MSSRRPLGAGSSGPNGAAVAVSLASFWDSVAVFPPPSSSGLLLLRELRLLQPTALCHGWQTYSLTVCLAVAEIDLATDDRSSNNKEKQQQRLPDRLGRDEGNHCWRRSGIKELTLHAGQQLSNKSNVFYICQHTQFICLHRKFPLSL